MIRNLL